MIGKYAPISLFAAMCAAAPAVSSTASFTTPPFRKREVPVALRERLRVRHRPCDVAHFLPGKREQAVVDFKVHLADDVQTVRQNEVVVPVDASPERVLERQNRAIARPLLRRLERVFELRARTRLAVRVRRERSRFAVRTGHALVRHANAILGIDGWINPLVVGGTRGRFRGHRTEGNAAFC